MSEHTEVERLLARYHVLTAAERDRVDTHAAACPACGAVRTRHAAIDEALARLPAPWPDRWARTRLHEALQQNAETQPRRPVRRLRVHVPRLAWLAIALLAVVLLLGTATRLMAQGRFDLRLALHGRDPFLIAPTPPPGAGVPDATGKVAGSAAPAQPQLLPNAGANGADTAANPEAWLKQNAIPFDTAQPGGAFADLMPIKDLVGNARIVALGDAAYGTHESLAMKQRLLEFLVQEMGFNTIAIEAGSPQADLINQYVRTGNGDPERLMLLQTGGFRQTGELLYTVRWLRTHNESGPRPGVNFAGFDILQDYSHFALDQVVSYLQRIDPDAVYRAYGDYQELLNYLMSQRSDYVSKSSFMEFGRTLVNVRALIQHDAYAALGSAQQRNDLRNRYMAENIARLLRRGGNKIILWGDNATLAADPAGNNLGALLRRQYGQDLVVIGSSFYRGSLNTSVRNPSRTIPHSAILQVPPPPAGSYEDLFQQVGMPRFILDLRRTANQPAAAWLQSERPLRNIQGPYSDCFADEYFTPVRLAKAFDGFIYLGTASPTTMLFQIPAVEKTACASGTPNS